MKKSRVAIQTDSDPGNDFYLTIDGIPIPGAQSVGMGQSVDDEFQEVTVTFLAKKVEFAVEDTEDEDLANDKAELAEEVDVMTCEDFERDDQAVMGISDAPANPLAALMAQFSERGFPVQFFLLN